MTETDLRIKLLSLPDDYKGILVIEYGSIELKQLTNFKTKANVQIILVRDIDGIEFYPPLKEG